MVSERTAAIFVLLYIVCISFQIYLWRMKVHIILILWLAHLPYLCVSICPVRFQSHLNQRQISLFLRISVQVLFIWAYSDKDISHNDSSLIIASYVSGQHLYWHYCDFRVCHSEFSRLNRCSCVAKWLFNSELFLRWFGHYVFPIDFAVCVDDNDPTDLTGVPVHDGTSDGLITCTLQLLFLMLF